MIVTEKQLGIESLGQEHPLDVVMDQANDEALWFAARYAPEAFLQVALRRLHRAVEAASNNGRLT